MNCGRPFSYHEPLTSQRAIRSETLYGFADALIEYGFIDAIYVTGGSQPDCFYREYDGSAHGQFIDDKPHELVVWCKPE